MRNSSSDRSVYRSEMRWTYSIIWFLYVSICECGPLPDPGPVMYGEVQSPQYPGPYPPNLQEQWDLSVPEGFQIRLTFTHLDIEASADCHYDSLTVLYNGKVLGKFCGQENSADGHHPGNQHILSPGNRLTLVLQTDDGNPERHQNVGFSAHYQAIDIDECSAPELGSGSGPLCSQICLNTLGSYLCSCYHGYELRQDQRTCVLSCVGGIFDEPEGHLSSPGYPNPPPHAVDCQYVISVESGFIISLNFTENFSIESVDNEEGLSCPHHWLQVTISDRGPRKLCGEKSPGLMVTNSNKVTLDYHIDTQGQSNGWSLDYSTERVKCPSPGSVLKGRVTPILAEYFYRDYIFVRCDQGYKLMMNGYEIDSFSTMCQSNGQWHLPLPECHIIDCGEPEPLLNGGLTFLSGFQNQYRSVVQYHCNEPFYSSLTGANVSLTCEADRRWRAISDATLKPTCIPVCGEPTNLLESYQRIIGGSDAPEGAIPWQTLLTLGSNRGGGMVIADRWVMTAAHVLVNERMEATNQTLKIAIGITEVESARLSTASVESIHVHPGYNRLDTLQYDNDIALIKLQDRLTFNSSIMPICLPPEGATYTENIAGLASGFGITRDEKDKLLITNRLKYVRLPVVGTQKCRNSINELKRTNTKVPHLTANMFCAGVPEGGKDSCQGDSGSAFALRDNGKFWAAGIVSWGVDCGVPGRYGVYTKVANYVDWIHNTIQEN